MAHTEPIPLLRELKGAPLSVLIALHHSPGAATPAWLRSVTGYSQDAIAPALKILEALEYTEQVQRYLWRLTTLGEYMAGEI